MRIAGGTNRGQRLRYPIGGLRPTRNMVKQAILNILRPHLGQARILDLFSGSGALGIEALSAGAESALFVEQNRRTVALLRQNLKPYHETATVMTGDVRRTIALLSGRQFDIILADPPYEEGLDTQTLALISQYDLLAPTGIVVLEHSRRDQPCIPYRLALVKAYRYGDTTVSTFRNTAEAGHRARPQSKSGGIT